MIDAFDPNPLEELASELAAGTLVPRSEVYGRDEVLRRHIVRRRSRRHFDVWHEVPLIPQLTGMSCWAAAAAMIVGWRDRLSVEPEEITRGLGAWRAYRDGLLPTDVESMANAWGLSAESPGHFEVDDLRRLLERQGPLWIGEADPGLHVVVIVGIFGDSTPEGTWVRVNDPWPIGLGSRYALRFGRLTENFDTARNLGGLHAQILHAGEVRAGPGTSFHSEKNFEEELFVTRPETRRP